ncbi:MAG: hypothetical protein R2875_09145 [Desulfobacterales bacterium]
MKGMLPKNPLGRSMFGKLKVYAGSRRHIRLATAGLDCEEHAQRITLF